MHNLEIVTLSKRNSGNNNLIISVDLDMWWHCRWATGSPSALWKDTKSLFLDYYGSEEPADDLKHYTRSVLSLLKRFDIKATFFVLGEIASYYPNLVKEIHNNGHEIACHGWYHVDASTLGRNEFRQQVGNAKKLLEDITGNPVLGYRAPNLVITSWLAEEIFSLGFIYDSSICPSRKLFGKYERLSGMPNNPFTIRLDRNKKALERVLVEIPVPTMPYIRLPACSGIITRVLGKTWTKIALSQALKHGNAMYYFHPYEIGDRPALRNEGIYIRLFFRNLGEPFVKMLEDIFEKARCTGTVLAKDVAQGLLR